MANNLKDHLKEVADAIRAKEGTSDLINPQDFATKIGAISGGGEADSGGDWEYYDCSNSTEDISMYGAYFSARLKMADVRNDVVSKIKIGCVMFAYASSDYDKYIAIAVDFSQPCIDANGTRTLREQIALYPDSELALIVGMLQSLPRITKEQFYTLE